MTLPHRVAFNAGFEMTPDYIGGRLDVLGHILKGPITIDGFASAWLNTKDFGAVAGIRGHF